MPIRSRYDRTVSTKRLENVAGSYKETWQDNLSGVACAIQPQSAEHTPTLDGANYKLFKMWCPADTDILTGDKVIDGDYTFHVRSVSVKNYGSDEVDHLVVMLSQGE